MERIVVIGSSGHAKVVIDIIEREGKFAIAGLIDSFREVGEETLGHAVLGDEDVLKSLVSEEKIAGGVVGIGDNFARHEMAEKISAMCPGFVFPPVAHPSACVGKDTTLGEGTVLMAGAVINPCCTVGRFCVFNTRASLDHDSVMEDYSSLGPGVATGGNVRIGSFAAIGVGATVIHGAVIGEHTVIGAGATVVSDIASHRVAYGTPAKVIRERTAGEKYL